MSAKFGQMVGPLGLLLKVAFMENLILPSFKVEWLFQELEGMLFLLHNLIPLCRMCECRCTNTLRKIGLKVFLGR